MEVVVSPLFGDRVVVVLKESVLVNVGFVSNPEDVSEKSIGVT